MASAAVPAPSAHANTSSAVLHSIRAAHRASIAAAFTRTSGDKHSGRWAVAGMPGRLQDIGTWLAAQGFQDEPTDAERNYGMDFDTYRELAENAAVVEAGRKAIFEGRRPLYCAAESAPAFQPTEAEVEAARANALSAAWDEMAAAASDFTTDAFERARGRFYAIAGER